MPDDYKDPALQTGPFPGWPTLPPMQQPKPHYLENDPTAWEGGDFPSHVSPLAILMALLGTKNVSPAARRPGFADVYHGSTANIAGGLEPRPGAGSPHGTPAISFATTPEQANAFASTSAGRTGDNPAVYRRRLDTQGFPTIDWASQSKSPEWTPWDWQTMLKVLSAKGAPGALVKGMQDRAPGGAPIGNASQYVVLDPSRVHDWNAK